MLNKKKDVVILFDLCGCFTNLRHETQILGKQFAPPPASRWGEKAQKAFEKINISAMLIVLYSHTIYIWRRADKHISFSSDQLNSPIWII